MAETHFISRLKQLRAERMGKRQEAEAQIKTLEAEIGAIDRDIEHIDAVARMEQPDIDFGALKPIRRRRPNVKAASPITKTGLARRELPKLILSVFRDAANPLCSRDVVQRVADLAPEVDFDKVQQQVYAFISRSVQSNVLRRAFETEGIHYYVVNR